MLRSDGFHLRHGHFSRYVWVFFPRVWTLFPYVWALFLCVCGLSFGSQPLWLGTKKKKIVLVIALWFMAPGQMHVEVEMEGGIRRYDYPISFLTWLLELGDLYFTGKLG